MCCYHRWLGQTCYYDTSHRTTPTPFGEQTTDEMCLSFLYYYPKTLADLDSQCHTSSQAIQYCSALTGPSHTCLFMPANFLLLLRMYGDNTCIWH